MKVTKEYAYYVLEYDKQNVDYDNIIVNYIMNHPKDKEIIDLLKIHAPNLCILLRNIQRRGNVISQEFMELLN